MVDTFLNGDYYNGAEARVSIEDRGFLFGDGIYEVIRFYHGSFFELGQHLSRLARSARKTYLDLPNSLEQIDSICHELLKKSGIKEGKLYLQVTRGAAPRTHEFPVQSEPTIMMKISKVDEEEQKKKKKGVSAITVPDDRWSNCDIKSLNLLPNVLAKQKARSQGYYEAIFVFSEKITEGASSNVFAVLDGVLVTAPECNRILSGITRNVVLELASQVGIPWEEKFVSNDDLYRASELFITSTVDEITPILSIDGQTLNGSAVGKVSAKIQNRFQQKVSQLG